MKYLLISDTHGQLEKTRNLILQYPLMDGYFHMGDVGFALSYLEQFHIVRGNHDRHTSLPMELRFTLGERNVCMEIVLMKKPYKSFYICNISAVKK